MLHEDASCRFVIAGRRCDIVLEKGWNCACGHDLEWGCVVARQRFEDHVRGALAAGANADVADHSADVRPPSHGCGSRGDKAVLKETYEQWHPKICTRKPGGPPLGIFSSTRWGTSSLEKPVGEQAQPHSNGSPQEDSMNVANLVNPAGGAVESKANARQTKGKYTLTDFQIQRTLGTGSIGRVHLVQSKHDQML
jgi:hypothetical protein